MEKSKNWQELAGIVIDKIIEYNDRIRKGLERRRIKKDVKRNFSGMLGLCERISSRNQCLTEDFPQEETLDEILRRDYPGDYKVSKYKPGEQMLIDFEHPEPAVIPVPTGDKISQKRFFGKMMYEGRKRAGLNMFVITFDWDVLIGKGKNSSKIRRISHGLSYFLYPQDFLHVYTDLTARGYGAIGALGFLLDRKMDECPYTSAYISGNRKFNATVYQGIISGRITLKSREDPKFDPRKKECSLEICDIDKQESFHSDDYSWKDYDKIINWIKTNQHEHKLKWER